MTDKPQPGSTRWFTTIMERIFAGEDADKVAKDYGFDVADHDIFLRLRTLMNLKDRARDLTIGYTQGGHLLHRPESVVDDLIRVYKYYEAQEKQANSDKPTPTEIAQVMDEYLLHLAIEDALRKGIELKGGRLSKVTWKPDGNAEANVQFLIPRPSQHINIDIVLEGDKPKEEEQA